MEKTQGVGLGANRYKCLGRQVFMRHLCQGCERLSDGMPTCNLNVSPWQQKQFLRHINQPYWGGGNIQLHLRLFHQCLEVTNESKTPNVHLVGYSILQRCGSQACFRAGGPDLTWFWLQGTWTAATRITIPAAARLKLMSQPLHLKRDHPRPALYPFPLSCLSPLPLPHPQGWKLSSSVLIYF